MFIFMLSLYDNYHPGNIYFSVLLVSNLNMSGETNEINPVLDPIFFPFKELHGTAILGLAPKWRSILAPIAIAQCNNCARLA